MPRNFEGVSGRKHDFVILILIGPKGPPDLKGKRFGRVWRPETIWGRVVATPILPPKMAQKIKNQKQRHIHNLDFSLPIDR